MKIRIEFEISNDDIDSKSDMDAAVGYWLLGCAKAIERESFDKVPEYSYED